MPKAIRLKKVARTYRLTPRSKRKALKMLIDAREQQQLAKAARRIVADPAMQLVCLVVQATCGSCANAYRWKTADQTVRWCAYVLGARRALKVASEPREWHQDQLRRMARTSYLSPQAPGFSEGLAFRALQLMCVALGGDWARSVIERGPLQVGAEPPWLRAEDISNIELAERVDEELGKGA